MNPAAIVVVACMSVGALLCFFAGFFVGVHRERFKPRTLTEEIARADRQQRGGDRHYP